MNFIGEYQLEDTSVCDKLIEYFENSDRQAPGLMGRSTLNVDMKDSVDVSIHASEFEMVGNEAIIDYLIQMDKCLDMYVERYPECNEYGPWSITEGLIIQKYKPGQGYKCWHCERTSAHIPTTSRHLVFMTYLNDVTDEGGTEFKLQNKTYQPVKGKTLFWPADWTHTHRGIVSESQTKYVVSGWFNYH